MADVATAEEAEPEEVDGEEQKPAGRKRLIIIAAAALLVAIGLGAGAYFLFFAQGDDAMNESGEVVEPVAPSYFYDLPEMLVNLNTEPGAEDQFLKLTVSLELSDEAMLETLVPRVARVLDAFQVYLRELRRSDLEGSAGIYRLKEELRRRVNLAIYPAEVENILFKEILVQ